MAALSLFIFLKTRLLKAINYISLLFVSGMTGTQVKDLGKMFFPFFGFRNIDRYWLLC